jgi:hypothetical protein
MLYRVETISDRRSMKDFLRLPSIVYQEDPNWVPPVISEVRRILDVKLNPYFEYAGLNLLICYRDRQPAARCAIIIDHQYHRKFKVKMAFFGFFEALNDPQAVQPLFKEAELYCRAQGIEVLEGPFNPNHYSELGILLNQFDSPPTFFQTYNPSYYSELLEGYGFRISAKLHTRKNSEIGAYIDDRFCKDQPVPSNNGLSIRPFRLKDFNGELEKIKEIYNDAFSDNWHFLPVSREEYFFSAKYLKLVTTPELIQILEQNGEPVGVVQFALDINPLLCDLRGRVGPIKYLRFLSKRKKIRNLVVFAVAIKKSYQRTSAFKKIFETITRIAKHYRTLETTWMMKENIPVVKAAEKLGLKPDRQFAIYAKRLK